MHDRIPPANAPPRRRRLRALILLGACLVGVAAPDAAALPTDAIEQHQHDGKPVLCGDRVCVAGRPCNVDLPRLYVYC